MKLFVKTHLKFWYVHFLSIVLGYYAFITCVMMLFVMGHYEDTIPIELSLFVLLLLFAFTSTLPFIIPNYFVVRRSHDETFELRDYLRIAKYQFFTFVAFIPVAGGISIILLQ